MSLVERTARVREQRDAKHAETKREIDVLRGIPPSKSPAKEAEICKRTLRKFGVREGMFEINDTIFRGEGQINEEVRIIDNVHPSLHHVLATISLSLPNTEAGEDNRKKQPVICATVRKPIGPAGPGGYKLEIVSPLGRKTGLLVANPQQRTLYIGGGYLMPHGLATLRQVKKAVADTFAVICVDLKDGA